jgi:hypothetical protein
MRSRYCNFDLTLPFIALGSVPRSNAYLTTKSLQDPEEWFLLWVLVCSNCCLAQTKNFIEVTELFDTNYAYSSSFSFTCLAHA